MEFIVKAIPGTTDTMLARYDCSCGCKPNAEYKKGSEDVGYEHCCCGNVHFLGPNARQRLEEYLGARRAQGLDVEVGDYSIQETEVSAPWGQAIPIAYAIPAVPRPH